MNDDGHGVVTDSATREIGTSARSVGSLVAKQAERAKLSNISLPSAYRELGQQVFESGNRRDFPDLHDRIDEIVASIDQLNTDADGVEPADTLGAKAKAVLDSGKAAAKRKVLERTRSQAFIELGKATFEHDDQHGALASKKIAEVISRLAVLDREIEELKRESSEGMKKLRTNPVVIGVLLACFFPVGLFLVWRHPTWSRNQKLGWTGVLAAVLVMGMVMAAIDDRTHRITADYLPHKVGAIAYYEITIPGVGVSKHAWQFETGEVIKTNVETIAGKRVNTIPKENRVVTQNGFIGVLNEDGQWTHRLKLGAQAGDSWSHEGVTYTVDRFGTFRLAYDGSDRTSVDVTIVHDSVDLKYTDTYVNGIGLVSRRGSAGGIPIEWNLEVMDGVNTFTGAERAFFE